MQMDLQFRPNQLVFIAVLVSAGLHGLLLSMVFEPIRVRSTDNEFASSSLSVELMSVNNTPPKAPAIRPQIPKPQLNPAVENPALPSKKVGPKDPPVPTPDTSASGAMNALEDPTQESTVGLKFRPELKKRMEETKVLREKWEGNDDPLEQKADSLLWRKNGCFEITDNEDGNGQTFQFSSKCSSTDEDKIDLNSLINAIKPTYGSFSKSVNP